MATPEAAEQAVREILGKHYTCEYERAQQINDVLVSISERYHVHLLRLVSTTRRNLPDVRQLTVSTGAVDTDFEEHLQQAVPIVLACAVCSPTGSLEERLATAFRFTSSSVRTACLLFWMGPTAYPLALVHEDIVGTYDQQIFSIADWTRLVRHCWRGR